MATNPAGSQANDSAIAGVIARPPLLFLGALLLGIAADRLLPSPFTVPGGSVRWIVASFLILVGGALVVAAIGNFSRAATPVPTNRPTRALVTTGIHRWSRNPIYVGFFLIYVGIGIATCGPWILILVLPLALTIRYGVVAREEAYLEQRFGEVYRDYKTRVRRWL
jgi:protein-S-isoprenylcysteine O-methyltransferase Ste14